MTTAILLGLQSIGGRKVTGVLWMTVVTDLLIIAVLIKWLVT